jgi:uncharacterized protein YkwD
MFIYKLLLIRRHGLVVWGALLVMIPPAPGMVARAQEVRERARAGSADPALAADVLAAHNKVRAEEKLPPLSADPKLTAAAKAHAEDMAKHETMTHEGTDGSTPAQRIERQGYHARASGENVAEGQTSAESVMRTWLNSPPHRKNILGPYSQVGIAVARGKGGEPYWAVDFGTPWPVLDPAKAAAGVVEALNKERKAAGKKPLKAVDVLNRVAADQAKALARGDSLEGGQGQGRDVLAEVRESGYRYRKLAEVSASGQPEPSDVVSSLMMSDEHKENLLGDFTDVGVGYATSPKGTPFWCLILARPLRN